jgi:hypothetical protein
VINVDIYRREFKVSLSFILGEKNNEWKFIYFGLLFFYCYLLSFRFHVDDKTLHKKQIYFSCVCSQKKEKQTRKKSFLKKHDDEDKHKVSLN